MDSIRSSVHSLIGGDAAMKPQNEDGREEMPGATRTRRGFLRDLTAGSVAAAVAAGTLPPALAATEGPEPPTQPHHGAVKVFRLQPRGRMSCRACQLHHRYKIFRTHKDARRNRAHPGCDCPIVPQWLPRKTFRLLFKPPGAIRRQVVDLRAV
jgi:hypothetical protein